MAVFLTGDIHGLIDDPDRFEVWNFPEGENLTRNDYVIVLGDFGMPFDMMESDDDLRKLASKPWTTLFVDGNHERFDFLNRLPETEWRGGLVHRYPGYGRIIHLMRGEVYDIDGRTFFAMGGATSVDKCAQQVRGTWFPEELPDEREYRNARKNLEKHGWKVDFILSHTCATSMLPLALQCVDDGSSILTDELTDFLDELETADFKHWFFGHFHNDLPYLDARHTCLYQTVVSLDEHMCCQPPSGIEAALAAFEERMEREDPMTPYIDSSALSALLRNPDHAERTLRHLEHVLAYAKCVMAFAPKIEAVRALHGPDDASACRAEIESIDRNRTGKHDAAISSLATLNNLAARVQCPPVYVGDIKNDDRKVVAHAIFEFAAARLREEDATI